jgi:hypothetical protein
MNASNRRQQTVFPKIGVNQMRVAIKSFAVVLAIAAMACNHSANTPPQKIVFRHVSAIKTPSSLKTLLKYGHGVPDPKNYPASFASTFDVGVECSATLVGADSILTAGHCVDMASSGHYDIFIEFDGKQLRVNCDRPKKVQGKVQDDIGLCKVAQPVDGILFDVIGTDEALAVRGHAVQLTGWAEPADPSGSAQSPSYSSSSWLKGGGPEFQEGTGRIVATGRVLSVLGDWANGGRVVIEEGDSGGAGYVFVDTHRIIVGVNVCGGQYCFGGHSTDGTSKLTNVTDENVLAWIKCWVDENKALLCGYNSTKGCRS